MNKVMMRLRHLCGINSRQLSQKSAQAPRRTSLILEQLESRDLLAVALLPAPSSALSAAAQLALVQHPADNPALPAGMDVFNPPVANLTPSSAAPQLATLTSQANPDDSLATTGFQFSTLTGPSAGQDTVFQVYGQTTASNSDLTTAAIQELNGDRAVVTLNAGLPKNSMYLVWAENAAGASLPFAVNKTTANWAGPDAAAPGATVSIYGQNLSNGAATPRSWIYLQPAVGHGQWITPTAVNPYKVDFVVPAGLAAGSYQLWVHNGHGGQYGWSSPVTLTVQPPINYGHLVVKLSSFPGGLPNTGVDAAPAFQAAIQAIGNNGPGTIQLQAGTYYLSATHFAFAAGGNLGIYLHGAGKNVTFIKALAGFSANNFLIFGPDSALSDVTVDTTGATLTGAALSGGSSITNVAVIAHGFADYGSPDLDHFLLKNDDFVGRGVFLTTPTQVIVTGCNFYATDQTDVLLNVWGGSDISVTNCTAQDFNVNSANHADHGEGRFFSGSGIWGTQSNVYIGDNKTIDFSQPYGYGDQNVGEQIMWEGCLQFQTSMATSATSNTVTLTALYKDWSGQEAEIVGGKGTGEHRTILATDFATGGTTLTLDSPWDVVPDSTSQINIVTTIERVAVYHNTLQGSGNLHGPTADGFPGSASCGIEPFGGGHDLIIDSNTISALRYGVSTFAFAPGSAACAVPLFDNIVQNNTISNCVYGIRTLDSGSVAGEAATFLGNMYRNNTMTAIQGAGVFVDGTTGPTMDLNVFEHNHVKDAPNGIYVWRPSTAGTVDFVVYKNVFDRGTAPLATSQAISSQPGHVELLSGNMFLNWLNLQNPIGTITSGKPTFSWNAIPGATHYYVWVYDRTTGQNPVLSNSNVRSTSWAPTSALPANHAYTWYVAAYNDLGLVNNWSSPQVFFLSALGTPTVSSPVGSSTFVTSASLTPTFTWSAVAGADSYDVQVNDATTGQIQVVRITAATNSLTSPTILTLGHSYQWQVRALNHSGNSSPWSGMGTFTLILATPITSDPVGTVNNASPTFSWSRVPGADYYDYSLQDTTAALASDQSSSSSPSPIISAPTTVTSPAMPAPGAGSQLVTATSWTPSSPLHPGDNYTWFVRSRSDNGAASAWSAAVSFTVALLTTPTLTGPIGPVQNAGLTFRWALGADSNFSDLWVDDLTTGTAQVLRVTQAYGTRFPVSTPLKVGHTYRWKVLGYNLYGDVSAWSPWSTFTVVS